MSSLERHRGRQVRIKTYEGTSRFYNFTSVPESAHSIHVLHIHISSVFSHIKVTFFPVTLSSSA